MLEIKGDVEMRDRLFTFIELIIALAPIFAAIAYASMNKNKKANKL